MAEKPEGAVPWPDTEQQLIEYIREMLRWPDGAGSDGEGYGRCVYAMSNAASATFNYIAKQLGVTGFQAGAAQMEFIAEQRRMEHGFMILDGNDLLYPQYDTFSKVSKWVDKTRRHLAPAAQKLLDGHVADAPLSTEVRDHWEWIASQEPIPTDA